MHERIRELASYIVASGSGDNAHVYVELSSPVDHAEFIKLNTGLRDYLYGDNKQADNSLLRLPGTTNWKTSEGSPVADRGGNGRKVSKASLMKRRAFRDAKVIHDADAQEWSYVEIEGLSRRMQRMVNMPVAEATARYGNRHKAVWGIASELIKRGLDTDEVHSLMDKFPAAIDKMTEENGYDVHRDVDKCFAAHRAIAEEGSDLPEDEAHDLLEEMEAASDADFEDDYKRRVRERAEEYRLRRDADKLAREMQDERAWVEPPITASWGLRDRMKTPPPPAQYLIGIPEGGKRGLCGVKHNVIITAQYKTGKTKFVVSTIAKALCDAEDFMDAVPVHTPAGGVVVGHWNCEMDPDEMAAEYALPAGIKNVDNLRGADLRGHRVSLLSPQGRGWAIRWLKGEIPDEDGNFPRPVKVWTIDSLARLARMAGVSEKDNDEMFDLLMTLDEIKLEAGVDVIFLITHTGRTQHEEGKERARGATAIDDWCDARWILTQEDKIRFLAVDGRGVELDTVSLVYDEETGHSTMGLGSKAEVKADGQVQAVVRAVREEPGITQMALAKVMKLSQRAVAQYVEDAVTAGFIEVRQDQGGRGRPAKRHYLADMEPPVGDRTRKATPREVVLDTGRKRSRVIQRSN
ncbi:MAG: AAA family ATPase [Actinoplanes sp.]